MSEARLRDDPVMTILEFDGHIVGMTNPSQNHGQIVTDIGFNLTAAADRRRCHVSHGDLLVQRSADDTRRTKPKVLDIVPAAFALAESYLGVPFMAR